MAYSTENDIVNLRITRAELIALTDDKGDNANVDKAIVASAIARADADIDGACRSRYATPFNPVPDDIKHLSVDIAIYYLASRRRSDDPTIFDAYIKALARLKAIKEGTYSLEDAPLADSSGYGTTTPSGAVQEFTRTNRDAKGKVIGTIGSTDKW